MTPLNDPMDPLEGLRTLLDQSPDMLFRVRLGESPHFEFVSRAAEAVTGYPAQAFLADVGLVGRLIIDDEDGTEGTGLSGGATSLVITNSPAFNRFSSSEAGSV